MRIISTILCFVALGLGIFWVVQNRPEYKKKVLELAKSGTFHTLEARFAVKQIMEAHRRELLKTESHKYIEPAVRFFPYLLMEVKYTTPTDATGEGVILWDLIDGEMVLNTKNWEKTHGFGDCIKANTERYEFKIINLLSQRGGFLDRDGLSKALQIENNILDVWLDSCRRKKLIVQSGNNFRLHFQNANLNIIPETQIHDRLVTKSFKNAERVARKYSPAQIKKIAEAAFGHDFAIRSTQDVFLPVYGITVQNPDGSYHTSYWNALNGKVLSPGSLVE